MTDGPPPLFDQALLRAHRDRAAHCDHSVRNYQFITDHIARELLDRLHSITRTFERGLELGGAGAFARLWAEDKAARSTVGWLAASDLSAALLGPAPAARLVASGDALPVGDGRLDLIVSPLALHWVDDLPGALVQIRRALAPDGVFLGALFGGATLTELRQSFTAAELELKGGAAPRVSPFADVLDAARLLQRAGFALPVADRDVITVTYGDPLNLLYDLRGMGETNALLARPPRALTRGVLSRAMEIYRERFPAPGGRVRATFEAIYLTGWAPHPDQPQPKRPGSAGARLADALGVREQSAGEKAGPAEGAGAPTSPSSSGERSENRGPRGT
jgi:SAM-dependent methyltransferase